jgi:hypothetical protein
LGTFASRKVSPNVSHPCVLKYFLLRSTSFTKSTTLLPLTVFQFPFLAPGNARVCFHFAYQ